MTEQPALELNLLPEDRENFRGQNVVVFGGTDVHGNVMAVETEQYLYERGAAHVKVYCEFPGAQPAKFFDKTLPELESEGYFADTDRVVVVDIPLNLMQGEESRVRSEDTLHLLSERIGQTRQTSGKHPQQHNLIYIDHHNLSRFGSSEGILVKSTQTAETCHLGNAITPLTVIAAVADKDTAIAPVSTSDLEAIANGMHVVARESTVELRDRMRAGDWEYFRNKAEVVEAIRPPYFGQFGHTLIVESGFLPDTLVNVGLDAVIQRAGAQFAVGIVRGKEDAKMHGSRPPADIITILQNWKHPEPPSVRDRVTAILDKPFYHAGSTVSHYGQEEVWHTRFNSVPVTLTGSENAEQLASIIRTSLEGSAERGGESFTRILTPLEVERYATKLRTEILRRQKLDPLADDYTIPLYDDLKFAAFLLDVAGAMGIPAQPDFTQGTVQLSVPDQVSFVNSDDGDRQVFSVISFLGYLELMAPVAGELKNDPALGAMAVWNKTERNIPAQIYTPQEAINRIAQRDGIPPLLSESIAVMLRDETRSSYLRTQLLGKDVDRTLDQIETISRWQVEGDIWERIGQTQDLIASLNNRRFEITIPEDVSGGTRLKEYKLSRKELGGVFTIGASGIGDEERTMLRDYLLSVDRDLKPQTLSKLENALSAVGIDTKGTQIIVRAKSTGSALGKLEKKKKSGYTVADMTDGMGGRLIVHDVDELIAVSRYLQEREPVLEFLDFYSEPRQGDIYRAHHLILDADGKTAMELQIKTRLAALQTELFHDVAYKKEIYGSVLGNDHRTVVSEFCQKSLLYELLQYAHAKELTYTNEPTEQLEIDFRTKAEALYSGTDLEKINRAYLVAQRIHEEEKRKGRPGAEQPYIHHLLRVTSSVLDRISKARQNNDPVKYDDPEVVCAAILHDAKETSPMKLDFTQKFGIRTEALTETLAKRQAGITMSDDEYYGAIADSDDYAAALIKGEDRLDNVYSTQNTDDIPWITQYVEETEMRTLPMLRLIQPELAAQIESAVLLTKTRL